MPKRLRPVIEEVVPELAKKKEKGAVEKKAKELLEEISEMEGEEKLKETKKSFNGKSLINLALIMVLTTVVVGFIAGGVYVYFSGIKNVQEVSETPEPKATIQPTPTSIPSATPIPEEEIDVSSYKVSVLNGSGGRGVATAAADLLEEAGFVEVDRDNAARFDYVGATVQLKGGVSELVVEAITEGLGSDYTVKVDEENLAKTSEFDVVIIVGQEE